MKKSPLILMGILAFTVIVTHISAERSNPTRIEFSVFLQGSVAQGTTTYNGLWTVIHNEVITGSSLQGNLVGSPITFTILSNRRFKTHALTGEKSFINGTWTFVSSDGSSISGILNGKGTKFNEFSGKFVTTQSHKSTGIYTKAKISGQFTCRFIELPPYGASLGYEAWWNGTLREGGM